jgi:hypothetical protein
MLTRREHGTQRAEYQRWCMTVEFQDSAQGEMHDAFQQWRLDNPNGYVLNFGKSCVLHTSQCRSHFGDTKWTVSDFEKSLTMNRKVCAATIAELQLLAAKEKCLITWCGHCTRKLRASIQPG